MILAETLYVLCNKLQSGLLTNIERSQAIVDFELLMVNILPPLNGEVSLVAPAESIRNNYGCSRSADGIYIALAEMLGLLMPSAILMFDKGMQKQAVENSPSVTIQTLSI